MKNSVKLRSVIILSSLAAASSIFVLSALYIPTVMSTDSICISEMKLVGEKEKSRAAIDFARNFQKYHRNNIQDFVSDKPGCCRVDKGNGDDPRLGIMDYLFQGAVHYVHIPVRRSREISEVFGDRDVLIPVNSCGNPLYYGVHL